MKEKTDIPEKKEWYQVGVICASRAMNQNRFFRAVTSQKNLSYVNWSPDVALAELFFLLQSGILASVKWLNRVIKLF